MRPAGSPVGFVLRFFREAWSHRAAISQVSLLGYATLGLTFGLQLMIARLLGLQLYGVYAANLAVVALAEVPIVVRSGEIAMRAMRPGPGGGTSHHRALTRALVTRDVIPFVVASVLLASAGLVFGSWLNLDPLLLAILSLSIPAQIGYGAFKSLFFVHNHMPSLGWVELCYALVLVGTSFVGYLLFGIYGLAVATALSALAKTTLAYRQSRRFVRHRDGVAVAQIGSVGRDGAYSIARNGLANGLANLDLVMLGQTQSPEAVALYKVGKSLASLPIKVSFPLWRVLQPRLMSALNTGDVIGQRRLVFSGSFGFVLLLVAMVPLFAAFGADFIALAFGDEFRGAFRFFGILVVGVWAFHGIAGWFGFWSVVTQSQAYGILVYAIALAVLIVGGVTWGTASPENMAMVVSTSLLLASALAFFGLYADSRLRVGS